MSATHQLSHRQVALAPTLGHATAGFLRTAGSAVAAWLRHRRERYLLAGLDDRLLRDLGLTRGDVAREFDRPFWQPVDYGTLEAARRRSGPRLGARVSRSETVDG